MGERVCVACVFSALNRFELCFRFLFFWFLKIEVRYWGVSGEGVFSSSEFVLSKFLATKGGGVFFLSFKEWY